MLIQDPSLKYTHTLNILHQFKNVFIGLIPFKKKTNA